MKRIDGIDLARALAITAMIIVNFKMVFGNEGARWAQIFVNLLEGKAAATFVVLAGLGLALGSKQALHSNDLNKLKYFKQKLLKKVLFLWIIGLVYQWIWPADILHFYAIYILLTMLFLQSKAKTIFGIAILLIIAYPLLLMMWNYDKGWNYDTMEYIDFWTMRGFFRNLFYNGFHPIIPWLAFMLFGFWLGKYDLHNLKKVKRIFFLSFLIFIFIELLSRTLITVLSTNDPDIKIELQTILGTGMMPPLPLYMASGISFSFFVICSCILFSRYVKKIKLVSSLTQMGKMALTFYIAHIVIGVGVIELLTGKERPVLNVEFSILYGLFFSFLCVVFASYWKKKYNLGPLEWLMKKMVRDS